MFQKICYFFQKVLVLEIYQILNVFNIHQIFPLVKKQEWAILIFEITSVSNI